MFSLSVVINWVGFSFWKIHNTICVSFWFLTILDVNNPAQLNRYSHEDKSSPRIIREQRYSKSTLADKWTNRKKEKSFLISFSLANQNLGSIETEQILHLCYHLAFWDKKGPQIVILLCFYFIFLFLVERAIKKRGQI